MATFIFKNNNKIKLETGTYIIRKNKKDDCLLDLSNICNIPASFIGAMIYLKYTTKLNLFVSDELIIFFKKVNLYEYFKENILF
jgi:hypothetical protein